MLEPDKGIVGYSTPSAEFCLRKSEHLSLNLMMS